VTCGARVWDPVHLPPHVGHVGEDHGGAKRRRTAARGPGAAAAGGSPQQQQQGLQCSHCLRQEALTRVEECGTTLIVVPPAILNQVGVWGCVVWRPAGGEQCHNLIRSQSRLDPSLVWTVAAHEG
jgi:hypothetical protein